MNLYTNGRDYVIAETLSQAVQIAADFFGIPLAEFVADVPNDSWEIIPPEEAFTYHHTEEDPIRPERRIVADWLATESAGYFAYSD